MPSIVITLLLTFCPSHAQSHHLIPTLSCSLLLSSSPSPASLSSSHVVLGPQDFVMASNALDSMALNLLGFERLARYKLEAVERAKPECEAKLTEWEVDAEAVELMSLVRGSDLCALLAASASVCVCLSASHSASVCLCLCLLVCLSLFLSPSWLSHTHSLILTLGCLCLSFCLPVSLSACLSLALSACPCVCLLMIVA